MLFFVGPAGLPRFDLLAQINKVEARQEEYTESVAFFFRSTRSFRINLKSQSCCVLVLPAGLPRFDLLAQINEVEARQEEYTESLAFLGLVNALLLHNNSILRHSFLYPACRLAAL
jgi:hypothetical protein